MWATFASFTKLCQTQFGGRKFVIAKYVRWNHFAPPAIDAHSLFVALIFELIECDLWSRRWRSCWLRTSGCFSRITSATWSATCRWRWSASPACRVSSLRSARSSATARRTSSWVTRTARLSVKCSAPGRDSHDSTTTIRRSKCPARSTQCSHRSSVSSPSSVLSEYRCVTLHMIRACPASNDKNCLICAHQTTDKTGRFNSSYVLT